MSDFFKKLFSNSEEVSSSRFIMICSFIVSVIIAFAVMAVFYFTGKDYPNAMAFVGIFLGTGISGKVTSDYFKKA